MEGRFAGFKARFGKSGFAKGQYCPSCLAPVEPDSFACLKCGTIVRGRFARSSGLRSPSAIAAMALALIGGVATIAYIALAKGPKDTPGRVGTPVPTSATPQIAPAKPKTAVVVKKPTAKAGSKSSSATKSKKAATASGGSTATTPTTSTTTTPTTTSTSTNTTPTAAPKTISVPTSAAKTFNPSSAPAASFGKAANAVDGNPLTSWTYKLSQAAAGVTNAGLVIKLTEQHLKSVTITTDTPGMSVAFYGAVGKEPAAVTDPGWLKLATSSEIPTSTTVALSTRGRAFDYFLVLVTHAPPGVNVGTVDISGLSLTS